MRTSVLVAAILATAVSPALSQPKAKPKAVDHSSPKAVGEAFLTSMKNADWESSFACMTVPSRKVMLGAMMIVPAIAVTTDQTKKKRDSFAKLIKKHEVGAGGPKAAEAFLKDVKKLAALCRDLDEWMVANLPNTDGKPQVAVSKQIGAATFKDFKITGDRATAATIQWGKKRDNVHFHRVDGKWYLDIEKSYKRKGSIFRLKPINRKLK